MPVIEFSHRDHDGGEATDYSIDVEQITDVSFNPGTLILKISWRGKDGEQQVELQGEDAIGVFNQLRNA